MQWQGDVMHAKVQKQGPRCSYRKLQGPKCKMPLCVSNAGCPTCNVANDAREDARNSTQCHANAMHAIVQQIGPKCSKKRLLDLSAMLWKRCNAIVKMQWGLVV